MTDKEIIKALECCAEDEWCCNNNCPFFEKCSKTLMAKSSLDIINRQQAEIERLKSVQLVQANRIAELRGTKFEQINVIQNLKQQLITSKSEAVKEFADKLKNTYFIDSERLCCQVDKVLKEMVGNTE